MFDSCWLEWGQRDWSGTMQEQRTRGSNPEIHPGAAVDVQVKVQRTRLSWSQPQWRCTFCIWVLTGVFAANTHPSLLTLFHQKCSLAGFSLIPAAYCALYASKIEYGSAIQEYRISVSHTTQPSSGRLETLFSSPITLSKCLQVGHRYRLMSPSDTDQMDFSRSCCELRLGKPQNPLKGAPLIGRRPGAEVLLGLCASICIKLEHKLVDRVQMGCN